MDWLERQSKDFYVKEAKAKGYKSRAAFKLLEIDRVHKLLQTGHTVIDLGAAPGGWSQIAAAKGCKVWAFDLLPIDPPINGVNFKQMDILQQSSYPEIGLIDGVMSDMAPNTSGNRSLDQIRSLELVEAAFLWAKNHLKSEGWFLAKVFQGPELQNLVKSIKNFFKELKLVKPPASRNESWEIFILAKFFKN